MAVTGDSPENNAAALSVTVMARPTRLGRPRQWPPPLFFKLIAVGLRPIDRHPILPARQRQLTVVQRRGSEFSRTMRATRMHSRAGNRIVSVGTA